MMQRRPAIPSRPPFPYQLLEVDPEGFATALRENGYSEHAVKVELERLEKFHYMYKPEPKSKLNSVPVNDPEEKALKSLLRRKKKKNEPNADPETDVQGDRI